MPIRKHTPQSKRTTRPRVTSDKSCSGYLEGNHEKPTVVMMSAGECAGLVGAALSPSTTQEERDADIEKIMGWPPGSCGTLRKQAALRELAERQRREKSWRVNSSSIVAQLSNLLKVGSASRTLSGSCNTTLINNKGCTRGE